MTLDEPPFSTFAANHLFFKFALFWHRTLLKFKKRFVIIRATYQYVGLARKPYLFENDNVIQ